MGQDETRGPFELRELKNDIRGIRNDVDKLQKDLWIGNGKPGITTRLLQLEDAVERLEKALDKFEDSLDFIINSPNGAIGKINSKLDFAFTNPDGVIGKINAKIDSQNKYIWIGIGILITLQFVAPLMLKGIK